MCCKKRNVFLRHFSNAKVQPFFIQANNHQIFFELIGAFLSRVQRFEYKTAFWRNEISSEGKALFAIYIIRYKNSCLFLPAFMPMFVWRNRHKCKDL